MIPDKWGYFIFGIILLTIFQAIYDWSSIPMDLIDGAFASFSEWTKNTMPAGAFTNLIAEGNKNLSLMICYAGSRTGQRRVADASAGCWSC